MHWRTKDVLIVALAMLAVAALYWLVTHRDEGCVPEEACGITRRPN